MDSYSLGYANIALVKYWGKKSKDPVLPYNPNISLRLDNLLSKTKIEKNHGSLCSDGDFPQGYGSYPICTSRWRS